MKNKVKNIIQNIETLSTYISKHGKSTDKYHLISNLNITNHKLESIYSSILIQKVNNHYKHLTKNIIFCIIFGLIFYSKF
jgi:hypothetical protein